MNVSVSAFTRNYPDHLFQGDHVYDTVDGVCAISEPDTHINVVLWAMMMSMTVIICCVIVIALWKFLKEFWVETPDPEYSESIFSNGQFKTINQAAKLQEKEHFDELKPQMDIVPPVIIRGRQSDENHYQRCPSNRPKVVRILSQDSGFSGPDSPSDETVEMDVVFYNYSFQGEDFVGGSESIFSESQGVTEYKSELDDRDTWGNSVFSSGSADSDTEMIHQANAVGLSPIMSTTSTIFDEVRMADPYFKVSALTPSPHKTSSFPYMSRGTEQGGTADDRKDGGGQENDEYLKEYQLSPASSHMPELGDNSYLAMTATPEPSTQLTVNSPTAEQLGTPGGYQSFSMLEGKRGMSLDLSNNGYVHHEGQLGKAAPQLPQEFDDYVKQQMVLSPELEDYVKHQSISSPEVDYRDDYPGVMQENEFDTKKESPYKQEVDAYVHRSVPTSDSPNGAGETPSTSSGYSINFQMPYCKIVQGD